MLLGGEHFVDKEEYLAARLLQVALDIFDRVREIRTNTVNCDYIRLLQMNVSVSGNLAIVIFPFGSFWNCYYHLVDCFGGSPLFSDFTMKSLSDQ